MRIAVIFTPTEQTHADQHWLWRSAGKTPCSNLRDESEFSLFDEIDLIVCALQKAGYTPLPFAADSAASLCRFLGREKPDVIFNCCESFGGNAALEMNVAALFELFGISYTGSSAVSLSLALNKGITKALLGARGIPTPNYAVIEKPAQIEDGPGLTLPLIVKPLCEDASIGIDIHAVVYDQASLAKRVGFVLDEFRQPALVEEFIDGREITVAVLADRPDRFAMLPISEIVFDGLPEGTAHILGYEAKWVKDSPSYRGTAARCPADMGREIEEHARELTLKTVHALGVRDYGRVDFRLRKQDGALFVIDVNPNPHLNDETGFLRAARASGRTDEGTVLEIVQRAVERSVESPDAPQGDGISRLRQGGSPGPYMNTGRKLPGLSRGLQSARLKGRGALDLQGG